MRSILFVAALALAACPAALGRPSGGASAPEADSPVSGGGVVGGAEARRLVAQGAVLLDVRTPGEFAAGHIDGALNVSYDEVTRRSAELGPPPRSIVVYCHSGRRSAIAASELRGRGYSVWDLGAMTAW